MRYKVGRLEIRSENAAKPMVQRAGALVRWLRKMDRVGAALDYGCGKLRYSGVLAPRCAVLTLVDSKVQIDRVQKVAGKETTVRSYARKQWPTCRIITAEEFGRDPGRFDFVLCANVLSAIPLKDVRAAVLVRLRAALRNTGQCLFATQYQNSYFRKIVSSPKAIRHLDGWILKTDRGNFYYGILNREKLAKLVVEAGFIIKEAWVENQSVYVVAGRGDSR